MSLAWMYNNEVHLDKCYIDEAHMEHIEVPYDAIINACEDLIPIEEYFALKGQCCYYLVQDSIFPEDRECWMVIGNTDGFKIWVNGEVVIQKDEIRYWTPYNNSEIIKLKKGTNRIAIKLLKRTEQLKFSMGIRKYHGEHWHRQQWYSDFTGILDI